MGGSGDPLPPSKNTTKIQSPSTPFTRERRGKAAHVSWGVVQVVWVGVVQVDRGLSLTPLGVWGYYGG